MIYIIWFSPVVALIFALIIAIKRSNKEHVTPEPIVITKPPIVYENSAPDKIANKRGIWGVIHSFIFIMLTNYILSLTPGGNNNSIWIFGWVVYGIFLFFNFIAIQIDSIFYKKKIKQYYSDLSYFEIDHLKHLAEIDSVLAGVNILTDADGEYQPLTQSVNTQQNKFRFLTTACYQNIAPYPPPYKRYKKYKTRRY